MDDLLPRNELRLCTRRIVDPCGQAELWQRRFANADWLHGSGKCRE
jgi:hypothetical protein